MKNTFKQIAREFWFPFACAISWAAYDYWSQVETEKNLPALIKAFGAAFFFISWLLAQWFRIRKQQKVDGSLSTIETRVMETLAAVEARTDDLTSHITGGDTVCYLDIFDNPDENGNLTRMAVRLVGRHPLYDVDVYIANIDEYGRRFGENISFRDYHGNRQYAAAGDLPVGLVSGIDCILPIKTDLRYNIHFYARNGHFVQQLYLQPTIDGGVVRATRVLRGSTIVYENISHGFAMEASGEISWWRTEAP